MAHLIKAQIDYFYQRPTPVSSKIIEKSSFGIPPPPPSVDRIILEQPLKLLLILSLGNIDFFKTTADSGKIDFHKTLLS